MKFDRQAIFRMAAFSTLLLASACSSESGIQDNQVPATDTSSHATSSTNTTSINDAHPGKIMQDSSATTTSLLVTGTVPDPETVTPGVDTGVETIAPSD